MEEKKKKCIKNLIDKIQFEQSVKEKLKLNLD